MKPLHSRFQKEMDKSVQQYTASIHFDQRLFRQNIAVSIAHAKMLAKQCVISETVVMPQAISTCSEPTVS